MLSSMPWLPPSLPDRVSAQKIVETSLSSEMRQRILDANRALIARWPSGWSVQGDDARRAVLAMGLAMGNFGLVRQHASGGRDELVESNNWLKLGTLGGPDQCPQGSLYDLDLQRCVSTYPTAVDGIDEALRSLQEPDSAELVATLASHDLGKVAFGLLRAGYLFPAPLNKDTWQQTRRMLATSMLALDAELGPSSWEEGSYTPSFPAASADTGGSSGEGAEEASLSSGAKAAIGVGVAGLLGVIFWGLSQKPASRSSNPLDEDEKRQVASSLHTSPEILRFLAEDPSPLVRACVASNPKTPAEVLFEMANDPVAGVRRGVAINPNVPQLLCKKLRKDPSEVVRDAVQWSNEKRYWSGRDYRGSAFERLKRYTGSGGGLVWVWVGEFGN